MGLEFNNYDEIEWKEAVLAVNDYFDRAYWALEKYFSLNPPTMFTRGLNKGNKYINAFVDYDNKVCGVIRSIVEDLVSDDRVKIRIITANALTIEMLAFDSKSDKFLRYKSFDRD